MLACADTGSCGDAGMEAGRRAASARPVDEMNFDANIKPAKLRGSRNPMKAMTTGLFYGLAPKVGSLLRHSKLRLYKDSILVVVS